MKPKWLYRLEYKDNSNGLWYNGNGDWCFNEGIGQLDDTCQTKTLPMDYDWRYKQDGKDWFSSCSDKEDLWHWYSIEDAKKLLENGFVFTRYLAIDYHEYEKETVFLKETSLSREIINIYDLFNEKDLAEASPYIRLQIAYEDLKRDLDKCYGPIMRKILIKASDRSWDGLQKFLMPICVLIRQIRKGGKK